MILLKIRDPNAISHVPYAFANLLDEGKEEEEEVNEGKAYIFLRRRGQSKCGAARGEPKV